MKVKHKLARLFCVGPKTPDESGFGPCGTIPGDLGPVDLRILPYA